MALLFKVIEVLNKWNKAYKKANILELQDAEVELHHIFEIFSKKMDSYDA
jgi:hypothetical protein